MSPPSGRGDHDAAAVCPNHRNNPYILDRAFVQVRHSAAGVIWRFRTEVMTLLTSLAGVWELSKAVTTAWMTVIFIMAGTAVTVGCDSVEWPHRGGGKWPHLATRRAFVTELLAPPCDRGPDGFGEPEGAVGEVEGGVVRGDPA